MDSQNLLAHLIIVAASLFCASAWGHESGTPYVDWMKSLIRPDYPMSFCCGPGDQYYVREYRPSQKHGIAFTAVVLSNDGHPNFPSRSRRKRSFGTALTRQDAGSSSYLV